MRLPRSTVGIVLGLSVLIGSPGRGAEPDGKRPNVVVIVADDLGWNDVGYHNPEIATPNLDRLAASGLKLEAHYVFPTCSPTRCALLTSRNPSRFDILGPIGDRSEQSLPLGTPTTADVLKSVGYATAITGKWHLGLRPEVGPRKYGFDSTYGYLHGQIEPITHIYKNGDRTWHRDDQFIDETGHATDLLAAAAVRWVEAPRNGPFFLYLTFSVPHHPLREEERWVKPYEGKIADPSRRLFAAAVTHMDDAIGRVVSALERTGQRERTLIVFTSDNGGQENYEPGSEYGGKATPSPTLGNNQPLRGWKGSLYEGGVRVPALASWPGTLSPRVVEAPVSVLDWLPTLAKLTGARVDPNWHWEGTDVWPLLTGQAGPIPRRFYWRTGRDSGVRDGDWKLIVPNRGVGKPQLFNLAADPYETTDQADRLPDRVAALRARLAEERQKDQ
jgi:arylsulfatase A-like enzyme